MVNSSLNEDKRPFLSELEVGSNENFDCGLGDVGIVGMDGHQRSRTMPMIVILITLITTTSLMANIWMISRWIQIDHVRKHHASIQVYSPADNVVQYEIVDINTDDPEDIYNGPPTDESDRAWHDLLAPAAVRIYADEMRQANLQSVRVHDDNQEIYIGALEVYHQLHCVKRMIQNRWPERYPGVAALGAFSDTHFNHCIQVIRKSIMCKADRSIDTWTYNSTGDHILQKGSRKCVDWNRLHSWAQERTLGAFTKVDVYKPGEEGWYGPV